MEIATLAVQVDSRSVKSAESDLRGLTSAGQQAERSMGGVSSSSNQASQSLERQSNAARQLTAVVRQYAQIAMGAFSAQQIMRSADAWQQMQNRLRLVTSSTQELARATDEVFKISQRTSASMDATAQVFQRFAQNSTQLGISLDKVAELTETVSKAVAISGATAGAAEAALMQFGQALAAGALRGEELNSVLEQTPGLAQAIAVGMGVAVGSLKELAQEGRITGEVMVEALTNARNFVDDQFSTRIKTLSDHFVELGNASTRLIGELNESTGATQALGRGMEFLTENLSTAASVVGTLMAAHLANWLKNITMRAVAAGSAFTVLTRAASTLAGGPLGLVITAIGLGATAWQVFGRDAENALEAASRGVLETNNGLDAMLEKFKELNIVQQRMAIAEKQDALSQATKAASEALDELIGKVALAEGTRGAPRIRAAFSEALQGIVEDTEASSGEVAQSIMDLVDKMVSGSKLGEPYRQQLLAQIQAYIDLRSRISQYSAELSGMQAILEDVRRSLTGTNDALSDQQRALGEFMKTYATSSERMAAELEKWDKALGGLTDEQRQRIIDRFTPKVRQLAEKLTEAQKAQQAFERERQQALRAQYAAISAIHEEARGIEDQVALYGLSRTAIEDLTIARLEEQAALLSGRAGAEEQLEIFEREIEARKRLRAAIGSMEQKEAERAAWESWSRDVEQIFQQVGQSLTDALFEGGKSARDLIKDLFKTLTLRVLIQPVMGGLQGLFMGAGPAGIANAGSAAGGLMGSPTSLFSMFGGNSIGMGISNALTNLSTSSMFAGTSVGNWMMGTAGNVAGMSNLALGGAGFLGGIGAGLLFGNKGYSSAGGGVGGTIGMALGGPIGAIAGSLLGGALGSLFGDDEPRTRHAQRARVDFTVGEYGVTSTDDRQPGAEAAIRQMAQQAVESANALMRQIGVDAAIDTFYALTESSIKGDRQGVGSGGTLRLGDRSIDFGLRESSDMTLAGFGGWSEAEMLPRLAADIQISMLEAFQHVGASGDLPRALYSMIEGVFLRGLDEASIGDISARFSAVVEQVGVFQAAVERLPFAQLRDLSFDAAAGMVQFAGGIDNLLSAQQTYYDRYYSEQEKFEHSVNQLSQALSGVGLVMPELTGSTDDMLASYRALVESLDLNTEAGQQAYVVLMQSAGAFADVAQYAGQAAVEAARYAEQVLREREGLERQLLQLQGDTAELRRRELEALDESNRALQERIWAIQDEMDATAAAEARAAEVAQERYGLETQLLQLLGDTDALRARQLATLDESNHALQRRIWALQDEAQAAQDAERAAREFTSAIQSAYSALVSAGQSEIRALEQSFGVTDAAMSAYRSRVEQLRSDLTGVIDTMRDSVRALRGEVDQTAAMQYNQARAVISTSLVTGRLPQTASLSDAIQAAQQGVMDGVYATRFERDKAYLELANEIEAVQKIAEPQLTVAEATLERLEEQYDLLRGTHRVTSDSLEVLEYQLRTALGTEEIAREQIGIVQQQLDYAKGLYDRMGGVQSSIQGGFSALLSQFAKITGETVPAFAAGGVYAGGLALVGERGPELINFRQGGYVHTATETTDILRRVMSGGGQQSSRETEQLLREQLAEVRQQNRYLYEMVKSGKRNERNTEDVANAIAHGDSDGGVVVVM